MQTVKGNLLTFDADVIVQQCNCVTRNSHGLSKAIEAQFPFVDIYRRRAGQGNKTTTPDKPGNCLLFSEEKDDLHLPSSTAVDDTRLTPIVACLLGQWGPGKPYAWSKFYDPPPQGDKDDASQRLKWFKMALNDLSSKLEDKDIKTVAFPSKIGCGLAGGDWDVYSEVLEKWSNRQTFKCFIVDFNN